MSAENNVPAIRFEGFGEEWEEKTMLSITEVLDGDRGHNYPNGDDLQVSGHTLFLSASNVTANGFKLKIKQYISEKKSNLLGNGKLILNDIVLTSRGSVGHIAWYNKEISQKVPFARINSGMLILRPKKHIDPSIIAQFLKSPVGKKKIDLIVFGSAQPQLTKQSVTTYNLTIPNEKNEQTKIGSYFQQLDTLITQHQQKHDKLLNMKKALLEKMFPKQNTTEPEIRFKRFSGEWEEKQLMELGDIVTGSTPSTLNESYYSISGIPWVTPTDISENITFRTARYLSIHGQKVGRVVPRNTILVTSIASIGKNTLLGTKGSFNQQINALIPNQKKYNPYFLFSESYFWSESMKRTAASGTMQIVNKTEFSELHTPVPNLKEQSKIGTLFQQLDTLINQHQTQLKKLNNIKQACLEKMFV